MLAKPDDGVSSSSDVRQPVELKIASHQCLLVKTVATVTHDISFPGNAKAQSLVSFFFHSLSCSIRSSKGGKSHLLFTLTLFVTLSLSLSLADGAKGESHIIHRFPKAYKWAGKRV